MGKSVAIIVVGLFVVVWGCRTMSGTTTEIEHLYRGETVTLTCRGGEPVEEEGFEEHAAQEACADEHSRQRGGARALLVLGALAVGYGTFEYRKKS